ncbi:MAG: phospho-sugar mutase [Corynebacterium sp.]|uniref:phospho-sugar mutase n=1 Tax=Corynebacterium sp. TaxID=1720 RepID=UPI0026DAE37C|nr:phospho-sugar mutase [Corynebacterium sp.]MDO5030326.1 phospho-sugar mutase [Corynebacterium sp.]
MISEQLQATITDWIAHDPDEATAAELSSLYDEAKAENPDAIAELESRFAGPLQFGTAGLRGVVAAGQSRMNRATVIRATAGLVAHLKNIVGDDFTVVIGCDARHGSADFHRDAAAVVAAAGGTALALPQQLPTPVTAFAVRHLNADAGIMVTASHNPPKDNGYKVYLGGRAVDSDSRRGVQIIAPHDKQIAEAIAAAPPADEVPRDFDAVQQVGPELLDAYVERAASLATTSSSEEKQSVKIVITPMHGVGGETIVRTLGAAGFPNVHVVKEQFEPDPDFPTVSFPNPEEAGALDLAFELARAEDADVIIAADPDADRCSVAIPDAGVDGGWRQLSGDDIGAFLGEAIAADAEAHGVTTMTNAAGAELPATMANSIVSSRLLGKIAAGHGLNHRATLTGFKWIGGVDGLIFGYEEAIGYCSDPAVVRDKDGVSAAVRMADAVARLKGQGRGIQDLLDDVARTHGLYKTAPLTFRVEDRSLITKGMATLRANPPAELAGSKVTQVTDMNDGLDMVDAKGEGYHIPPTDGILILTEANDRVIARPSGTEPKLKCYLEVVLPVAGGASGDGASASADGASTEVPHTAATERLNQIKAELKEILGM